jgi:hypothetical protein
MVERGEGNLTLRSLERIAGRIGLDPMVLLQPHSWSGAPRHSAGPSRGRVARSPVVVGHRPHAAPFLQSSAHALQFRPHRRSDFSHMGYWCGGTV